MDLERYFREVTRIPGVSGHEAKVGEYIAQAFRPLTDSVEIDRMQNVIARVGNTGPKVMISAHMDEIGMLVLQIEDDGAIRLTRDGGVDPRILPGLEVEIQAKNGPIYGVIGAKAPQLLAPGEGAKAITFDDIYVDIGFAPEEVRSLVRVGDPVIMLAEPQMLADGCVAAKTMDDRASVGAMLVAAETLLKMKVDMQVYFVASTQEEVGAHGARAAAYGINPDWAIAIDVTHGEGPGTKPFQAHPLDRITIERGPFIHRALGRKLEAVAKANRIPFEIAPGGGRTATDADAIEIVHGGIPTTLLSIPLRYMHTTVETLKLDVVRDAGQLMAYMIAAMAEEWEGFEWC